jgi:hypothetical protein
MADTYRDPLSGALDAYTFSFGPNEPGCVPSRPTSHPADGGGNPYR